MSTTELPTYNGWPNYPTWNVALWMDNEQGTYEYARELAQHAVEAHTEDTGEQEIVDRDAAVYELASALEAWHEDEAPELEGFTADIFGWAMGFVDWRHIAGHLVDEVTES